MSRFSEGIINLRVNKGLSLNDLSIASGMTPKEISQLENGKRRPSCHDLDRLKKGFGVSLDCLFNLLKERKP